MRIRSAAARARWLTTRAQKKTATWQPQFVVHGSIIELNPQEDKHSRLARDIRVSQDRPLKTSLKIMHIKNLFLFVLVLWTLRWTDAYVGSPIVLGKHANCSLLKRVINIDIISLHFFKFLFHVCPP